MCPNASLTTTTTTMTGIFWLKDTICKSPQNYNIGTLGRAVVLNRLFATHFWVTSNDVLVHQNLFHNSKVWVTKLCFIGIPVLFCFVDRQKLNVVNHWFKLTYINKKCVCCKAHFMHLDEVPLHANLRIVCWTWADPVLCIFWNER